MRLPVVTALASILVACGGGGSAGNGGGTDGGTKGGSDGGSTGSDSGTQGGDGGSTGSDGGSKGSDGGTPGSDGGSTSTCTDGGTGIAHVVIIVQENHSFDTYFGSWCTAAPGSAPTCTSGPSCCEASPAMDPTGASPIALDDASNGARDPDHLQACELAEIDNGKMDGYVTNSVSGCGDARNFAIASGAIVQPYQALAAQSALADRYFQPIAGASSSNDMYLAVAKEVFIDDTYEPMADGSQCEFEGTTSYSGQTTIADLLKAAGKTVAWYGEGHSAMVAAGSGCPAAPSACTIGLSTYPCVYDPGDCPFLYYSQFASSTTFLRDYTQLAKDLSAGSLPDVSYVKAIGYHSEHPGSGDTISEGTTFVTSTLQAIQNSCYANDTLVLLTWDESGGFFDHVSPPAMSKVDNQPYGPRVPLLAIGRFAKTGTISHTVMEHSSIVKFLEYLYLGGKTGQLNARDAVVNDIGSLLDPAQTGLTIPDQ